MPEDQAPPVVAVVVASDSGPWFETCLAALAAQDYSNLTALVVDAASVEPLAPRVAAIAPSFYVTRLGENAGFGPSANSARDIVLGATYYLFCHDDVALEPDALRAMVEEALLQNAGIVGPKLVDAAEPDHILQLGLSMDRFGAPLRRVERREFDQSQHDEPREVFAVPGGCMLVRADLFAAIGGFDPEISMFGEDIDLSWRARIAGARVFVTPLATVRHLEATATRRRPLPETRALQWRHMLRAALKNYGPSRRTSIVVQLFFLSVLEVVYFTLVGRRRRAREVIDAWRWNLAPARDLDGARAAVGASRRVSDRVVLRLASRRSSRFVRAVRPRLEALALRWTHRRGAGGGWAEDAVHALRRPRWMTVSALLAGFVSLVGSRLLLTGHLPLVGGYLPIPEPFHLIATYLGGTTARGTQPTGPASPAFAILGLAGFVTAGSMGVVLKIGMVLAVVAGVWGVVKLVRPLGPRTASFAAGITYLFLPLAWNDLARGDLQALVVYGGMPWMLARVARATDLPPYGEGRAAIRRDRRRRRLVRAGGGRPPAGHGGRPSGRHLRFLGDGARPAFAARARRRRRGGRRRLRPVLPVVTDVLPGRRPPERPGGRDDDGRGGAEHRRARAVRPRADRSRAAQLRLRGRGALRPGRRQLGAVLLGRAVLGGVHRDGRRYVGRRRGLARRRGRRGARSHRPGGGVHRRARRAGRRLGRPGGLGFAAWLAPAGDDRLLCSRARRAVAGARLGLGRSLEPTGDRLRLGHHGAGSPAGGEQVGA
jgi:GT2 family glycosyltransferase